MDSVNCIPITLCYKNPYQLAPDDVAALSRLYPAGTSGKSAPTARLHGSVYFVNHFGGPGKPMKGVNVFARWTPPMALGWAKADDQPVVVVIDHLDGAGDELPHFGKSAAGEGGNLWVVFREEGVELLLGVGLARSSRGLLRRFAVRRFPSSMKFPDACVLMSAVKPTISSSTDPPSR